MMMRPRHYSTFNRSVARGITYALRDANRIKYRNSYNRPQINYNNANNVAGADISVGIAFVFTVFIVIVLAIVGSN